jgi:hypothetical protein
VRFSGDRVALVKIAEMGKAIDVHKEDELAGYLPPAPEKVIAEADGVDSGHKAGPPTLLKTGEKAEEQHGATEGKVIIPTDSPVTPDRTTPAVPPASESGSPASASKAPVGPSSLVARTR